jgi:hypothetical protein
MRQSASEINLRDRCSPERKSRSETKFPSKIMVLRISITSGGRAPATGAGAAVPAGGAGGGGAAARAITDMILFPDWLQRREIPRRKFDCSSFVIGSVAIRGSGGSPRMASSFTRYCFWSAAVVLISVLICRSFFCRGMTTKRQIAIDIGGRTIVSAL